MRLAQATFFEWVAALLLSALERSVLRLPALLNRGMLRRFGWLAPKKGERSPRQPWDRTSLFAAPKTAPIWCIRFIPSQGTNIPMRVRLICTPDMAIFAGFAMRKRET
jgi:hypothetical protein